MKIKSSKKKFYNKYDYKVTLFIEGCESLRYQSLEDTLQFLEQGEIPRFYISEHRKLKILQNKNTLIDLCKVLRNYDKDTWQKRIEHNCIDIYSNDVSLIDVLKEKFSDIITTVFHPSNNTIKPFTLQVKKFPHDIYKYRVYLLPHKFKNDRQEKENYISWIKSQNQKIKITDAVERWFKNTDWNWDPRYILVDEESTLLMLKLRNTEVIGRVYQFEVV